MGKSLNMDGALALSEMKVGRFFTREGKNPFEFDIYGNVLKWV